MRRKKPLLGPGARQIYAKCRSVIVQPLIADALPFTCSQIRVAVPWQRPPDSQISLNPTQNNGIFTYQPSCFDSDRFK